MQNRELTFRCITYNLHRMLNLIIIKWILLSLVLKIIKILFLKLLHTTKIKKIKLDKYRKSISFIIIL